ncbi:MAG: hypothetical protein PW792_14575 [Acidobacteriaceae bacterium]|nr:hypothetical protein [Acidobacteriaceae bacterium]
MANYERRSTAKVQISLPSGSYRPEFFLVSAEAPQEAHEPAVLGEPESTPDPSTRLSTPTLEPLPPATSPKTHRQRWIIAALAACGLFATVFLMQRENRTQANTFTAAFWQPLSSSNDSVLIVPGALVPTSDERVPMGPAEQKDLYPYTSFSTAVATANVIKTLSDQHKAYDILGAQSVSLDEMRHRNVVLLGAYNNVWLKELQKDLPLQFRFGLGARGEIYEVADAKRSWSRQLDTPLAYRADYALIARFRSSETGNWVFAIGGIGANGTEAASQFVSTSQYLDTVSHTHKDWTGKNVEVLLKLNVVDGKSGAPSVEEVRVW